MQKAKSRLSQQQRAKSKQKHLELAKRYLWFLPLLLFSLVMYGGLFWLVTNVYPADIAHFLFPNSYLPFTLLLFFANWFLLSYLFLNSRRGFIFSCLISLLVFLKLQRVVFQWQWLGPLIAAVVLLELILTKLSQTFSQS